MTTPKQQSVICNLEHIKIYMNVTKKTNLNK